jgi:hypothetical protein
MAKKESDSITSHEDYVDHLLVERLWAMLGPDYDPWGVGFRLEMLDEVRGENEAPYIGWGEGPWNARLHAERIRYIAETPSIMEDPIEVDNRCGNQSFCPGPVLAIYPEPIITDGNHRFLAHVWKKLKTIPASYGGRVDLLEYLTGESEEMPVDD